MKNKKKIFKYSLNCDCNHDYVLAKTYRLRPKNETNFRLNGKYFRRYYKCKFCEHHISDHNYDLSSIYSKDYIKFAYGNYDDLKNKFKKINNLNSSKSDNHHRCLRINSFFHWLPRNFVKGRSPSSTFLYKVFNNQTIVNFLPILSPILV